MSPIANSDTIASLVKENSLIETAIQTIITDYKNTTSMFIHELRNPLSLMKSTLQYIETKHPESKDFKYWAQLIDLVGDMEHMMAEASQLNTYNTIHRVDQDLISLIDNVTNSFMPQAAHKMIDLSMTVEEDCKGFFQSYSCDSGKIKQVLSNLIKNAFEATLPGNFINIKLSYLSGKNDILPKLSIQISNNGLPIPEDEINNIFQPFVTYKKGGSGIGLAVVKKIIELHYGSVSVSSDDMLTCFTLLLPVS